MKAALSFFSILSLLSGLVGCQPDGKDVKADALNEESPALTLTDSKGKACEPFSNDGRKGTVLVFLMNDCPVANASAPALARLSSEFTERGIKFYGVYTTETIDEISNHLRDYSLPFQGLSDPDLVLATKSEATRVPEAAVYSDAGELIYRGRIDDRAVSLGVVRPTPRREDLRLALEALLAGKKPEVQFTETVGCYLPFPLEKNPE